jgi:Flp pilus assembly protein TadD
MALGSRARTGRDTVVRLMAGVALAALLGGCSMTARQSEGPLTTGSIRSSAVLTPSDMTEAEAVGAVQKWGAAYGANEKNKITALNYAAALRAAGQTGQAVAVMRKAAIYHPEDREVLASFGKALAADGKFDEALATVQRAQRADNPDWQLLSAEGGILDSLGRHDEARARYQQALVLAPGEPQILNNLGLSYLLTNDLPEAEKVLRQAAASPRATLKIKENLALVLRLRGKGGAPAAISAAPTDVPEAAAPAQAASEEVDTWAELAQHG